MSPLPSRPLGRTNPSVTRLERTHEQAVQKAHDAGAGTIVRGGVAKGEPGVDTVIVGTLQPEHLHQNLRAVEAGPLPPDVYAEAKRCLDALN